MERGMLWFKCAAMHDPVRPVLKRPAALGWEAKERRVELVIERPPRGEELLYRMKGWFTADVYKTAEIIKEYGELRMLDDYHLVVEAKNMEALNALSEQLKRVFNEEVWIEHIPKNTIL